MTITALRPGGKLTPSILHELADDPELESYLIICNRKDGDTTVSWTSMKMELLTYSLVRAQLAVFEALAEEE